MCKPIIVFILFILIILNKGNGQITGNDSARFSVNIQNTTKLNSDTLKIQTLPEISYQSWYNEKSMPWIVALLISIFTIIVNIYISKSNLKSSSLNLERQINTSTSIANSQIIANKEITLKQFNAKLNTENRQSWLSDVRDSLSDLITHVKALNIEFQEERNDIERTKNIHDKVTYNHVKILLLLSPDKEHHKIFLQAMSKLMTTLDNHLLTNHAKEKGLPFTDYKNTELMHEMQDFIDKGRNLLYIEWNKIQKLL